MWVGTVLYPTGAPGNPPIMAHLHGVRPRHDGRGLVIGRTRMSPGNDEAPRDGGASGRLMLAHPSRGVRALSHVAAAHVKGAALQEQDQGDDQDDDQQPEDGQVRERDDQQHQDDQQDQRDQRTTGHVAGLAVLAVRQVLRPA